MITQKEIERINALARKSRTPQGLSEEEKAEQAKLRRKYVDAFKASLTGQLDNTVLVRPDGTKQNLSDLRKTKKSE